MKTLKPSIFSLFALVTSSVYSVSHQHQQYPLENPSSSVTQPLLGFGTWNLKISDSNTTAVVSYAIQTGYRQIDCAAIYGNEIAVGKGIKDGLEKAGLKREEIWVTSKLWNDHHGDPELAEEALDKTLKDLGLEYLDLYLMHWPVGIEKSSKKAHLDYVETWESMTALPIAKVHHIGVSNFSPHQLQKIISTTGIKPYAHQMELHPYLQQSDWIKSHEDLGISVTAYSPLGNSNPTYRFDTEKEEPPPLLENDLITNIALRRNCTSAQVALAWGFRRGAGRGRGLSVIPKSSHIEHIKENFGAFDCVLEDEDFEAIKSIEKDYVKRFNNPSKGWGVKLFEGLDDA